MSIEHTKRATSVTRDTHVTRLTRSPVRDMHSVTGGETHKHNTQIMPSTRLGGRWTREADRCIVSINTCRACRLFCRKLAEARAAFSLITLGSRQSFTNMFRKVVAMMLALAAANAVGRPKYDCDATACPSQCYCAFQYCQDEFNTYFEADRCQSAASCCNECACGSNDCLRRCATYYPWPEVSAVFACINYNCPQSAGEVAGNNTQSLV